MAAMPVITVSGGLASGARDVAQAVARELALDYVDQEILVEAARELGVSVAAVEDRDERATSRGERIAQVLRTIMERSALAGTGDPISGGGAGLDIVLARTYGEAAELPPAGVGQLDEQRYIATLTSVIKGIAARGNVVILGRGSQAILQHEPETLHVWVAAPLEHRIRHLVEREGMKPGDAEHRIKQSDAARNAFHQRYFKVDANSPALYDMGLNHARIRTDVAARMIAIAARELAPRPG
jgi:cytidylate kinase